MLSVVMLIALAGPGLCLDWSAEELVGGDDDFDDWGPSVTATPDGRAWVVWMGYDPAQMDDEVYYSINEGSGWSERERVHADNTVSDSFPEMDSGADGVPWAIWQRSRVGEYDLVVSHWAGSEWTVPAVVRVGGDRYDSYAIHVVDSSDVWVVTDAFVEGHEARWLLVYHWDGATWSEPWLVGHPGTDRGPDIRVAPDGRPWLVWIAFGLSGEPVNAIAYSVFENGAWSAPAVVNAEPGNGGLGPEILFDSDGTPMVVWEGNGHVQGGLDIEYSRLVGGSWTPAALVSEPETWWYATNQGLHSDQGAGTPLWVFWISADQWDFHTSDVTACTWLGSTWGPEEAPCDTTYGKVDERGDIAVAPDGSVRAAWMSYVDVAPYDYSIHASQGTCLTSNDLCCLDAQRDGECVRVSWYASGEASSGPFHVWRAVCSDPDAFGAVPPASALCLAGTWESFGTAYTWTDCSAARDTQYAYWLEWTSPEGSRYLGPASVRAGATWQGPARLLGLRPNPSESGCVIAYEVAEAGHVSVEICGAAGRLVRRLSAGVQRPARYDVDEGLAWDGKNDNGTRVAAGTYFVRLLFNGRRLSGQQGSVTLVR